MARSVIKRNNVDANASSDAILQGDLFLCEIASVTVKDDIASMEAPVFALMKQKDTNIREYRRGEKKIRIIPSVVGSATIFDKDLLIYAGSQIVAAIDKGIPVSRTVQIQSADFLRRTSRGDSRTSLENITGMLHRLRGTTIETNIETGNIVQTSGFSLIESYEIISEKKRVVETINADTGKVEKNEVSRILSFKITLSEWFYNSLLSLDVLTLDTQYFELSRSIDRRLYEIARKHCGHQTMFVINIDLLAEKVGTTRPRYQFRNELRTVIKEDSLPEYRIALDKSKTPDNVIFFTKDSHRVFKEMMDKNLSEWFDQLEKK